VNAEPKRFDKAAILAAAGPEIEALQAEVRRAFSTFRTMSYGGLAMPVLFVASAFFFAAGFLMFFVFLGFAVVAMVGAIRAAQRIIKARSRFMQAIAPALGLSFRARAPELLAEEAFRDTYYGGLFKGMRVEDVLEGARGGTRFEIFDAKLVGRSKGPDGRWRYGQPPKWMEGFAFHVTRVVRVEVPGRWTARTVILRDYGLANILQKPKGLERVGLVDSGFEKTFEVFSSDQTEARAFLHPALMERLTELAELFQQEDSPAVAIFEDGALYVALPLGAGESEVSKLTKANAEAINAHVIDRVFWELDAVLGVVDVVTGADSVHRPPSEEAAAEDAP
jgi:hypothetical protein